MTICYGTTGWALFFRICEIIMMFTITLYYTKDIFYTVKNGDHTRFEFLDWILIYLSVFQIYILFLSFFIGFYFGLSVVLEILKFSQNALIGGILLYQTMIWHKYTVTYETVKYYIICILIIDSILFISSFIENSFFHHNISGCKTDSLITLIIIGFVLNILIIIYALYKNLDETKNANSLNLLVEDQHNLNNLIQRFATNIKKMKKYYLIIVISFTFSYFVDIYLQFFMANSSPHNKYENYSSTNITTDNLTNIFKNNSLLNSDSDTFKNNTISYVCNEYANLNKNFNFMEYLICMISFFFRDIGPHIYIYLALFKYKPNINSRSTSFIELI